MFKKLLNKVKAVVTTTVQTVVSFCASVKSVCTATAGVVVGFFGFVAQSQAALSLEIATGLTAIQTDALALVDLVWPVVVAITGAFIIFKLFKRGVNKV